MKTNRILMSAVILFFGVVMPPPADAQSRVDDGMTCGSRLVKLGETPPEVLSKCGPPTSSFSRVETRTARGVTTYVTIDQWLYNLGPTRLMRSLVFENSQLVEIRALGPGR